MFGAMFCSPGSSCSTDRVSAICRLFRYPGISSLKSFISEWGFRIWTTVLPRNRMFHPHVHAIRWAIKLRQMSVILKLQVDGRYSSKRVGHDRRRDCPNHERHDSPHHFGHD